MIVIILSLMIYHVYPLCFDLANVVVENKYLGNNFIGKTTVSSFLDCAVTCRAHYGCLSFGFEPRTRAFHLHTRDSVTHDLIDQSQWAHGDVKSLPSELFGPCKNHNCSDGQKCNINRVTKSSYCTKAEFCPQPPEVSNSVISIGTQEVGSSRNYTCLEGYRDTETFLTSAVTTCLSNHTWSLLNLICTELVAHNMALRKSATSSSTYSTSPNSAVDGSNDRGWPSGSCFSVIYDDLTPWWQVDLQRNYTVLYVTIKNRADCCPERLHDFAVEVSNHFDMTSPESVNQLCYMYSGIVTAAEVTVHCTTPVVGRYVRVTGRNKLNYKDILQFCEVEVYCSV